MSSLELHSLQLAQKLSEKPSLAVFPKLQESSLSQSSLLSLLTYTRSAPLCFLSSVFPLLPSPASSLKISPGSTSKKQPPSCSWPATGNRIRSSCRICSPYVSLPHSLFNSTTWFFSNQPGNDTWPYEIVTLGKHRLPKSEPPNEGLQLHFHISQ